VFIICADLNDHAKEEVLGMSITLNCFFVLPLLLIVFCLPIALNCFVPVDEFCRDGHWMVKGDS
jgi:hypothetical protein